jgi:hypothetical protein
MKKNINNIQSRLMELLLREVGLFVNSGSCSHCRAWHRLGISLLNKEIIVSLERDINLVLFDNQEGILNGR